MKLETVWKRPGMNASLDWSPDGRAWVACEADRVAAFDLEGRALWRSRRVPVGAVRWSGGGGFVVVGTGSPKSKALTVLDATNGSVVRRLTHEGAPQSFAMLPGSERMYAAAGSVVVWDLARGSSKRVPLRGKVELRELKEWNLVSVSAEGRLAAAHTFYPPVWRAELAGGQAEIVRGDFGLERIAISPDGARIATVTNDGVVTLFGGPRETPLVDELPGDAWHRADLSWSQNGELLIVASPYASLAAYAPRRGTLARLLVARRPASRVAACPTDEDLVLAMCPQGRDARGTVATLLRLVA